MLGAGLRIVSIYCRPMADDAAQRPSRPVQAAALAAIHRRLARAEQPPWLHAEVARRMAERLSLIRLQPHTVVDWCSFSGGGADLLRRAYPRARLLCVETDTARLRHGAASAPRRWWPARRAASPALAPQALQSGAGELLWANMMLHLDADPPALMRQWLQALAVGGFLMFSTLGPGSLASLRRLYAQAGWPAPHAPFVDMHDLGDMLLHAGFADPVMDQELITLTWPDADALLLELRSLGGNADPCRAPGLRTPRWRECLCRALQQLQGPDGRLQLQFEVVYGHAFRAAPKTRPAELTTVALDELRATLRTARKADGLR
jgi:malonyl-CoA O-methyltransferase